MKQENQHNKRPRLRAFITNMNPYRWKLRWRITFYLLVFTCLILIILWLSMVVFLNKIYQNIKMNDLMRSSKTIVSSIDSDDLGAISTKIADSNEICIMIYNADKAEMIVSEDVISDCTIHSYLVSVTPFGTGYNYLRIYDLYEKAKASGGSIIVKISGKQDEKFHRDFPGADKPSDERASIVYVAALENKDGENIVIILNSVISPVNATKKTLRSLLFWLSGILAIAAIGMAFILSSSISKPISDLSANARELAKGDYKVHFDGGGYDEINELSESLNYAANELSNVDALRSELLANISHDLRTPLTLIAGYAEMMRDIPDENTKENLQIIVDESSRLKNLVNDALDISLLQSGAAKFDFTEFAFTNCIESELTRYNKLRECDGYTITFECDSLVTLKGDREKLMQAIYNLVNNAVNYSGDDNKCVAVRQTVKGKKVRIEVTDHGEGIAEDKLPLIWDRYYKVDKTHRRAQVGTGLGLSIVKGIIDAHGGSYGVSSKVGEGSTFFIELDIISSEPIENEEN